MPGSFPDSKNSVWGSFQRYLLFLEIRFKIHSKLKNKSNLVILSATTQQSLAKQYSMKKKVIS